MGVERSGCLWGPVDSRVGKKEKQKINHSHNSWEEEGESVDIESGGKLERHGPVEETALARKQ